VTKAKKLFNGAPRKLTFWIFLTLMLLLAFSLAACKPTGTAPAPDSSSTKSSAPATTGTNSNENPDQNGQAPKATKAAENNQPEDSNVIEAKWQSSKHASTYVQDGNNYNASCAQCHAPVNFVPSMDSMPESCKSCKFEIAPPPPLIAESEWKNVECKICHKVKKKQVQAEISWLEIPPIEEYSEVASTTELCSKCHTQSEPLAQHVSIVVAGAHQGLGCDDCHDPHDLSADCASSGCHSGIDSASGPIAGHDDAHAMVTCSACHDADGLTVGPDAAGKWVTFRPQALESETEPTPFTSHNTAVDVACDRCHFANNPWGLNPVDGVSSK